jgi:hypothetical protein
MGFRFISGSQNFLMKINGLWGSRTLRNKSGTREQMTESPPPSKAIQEGRDRVRRPTL